ncbi:MAG: 16S rRNA (guanine(966)-N(2))-methyltransferase RsmD [Acidimicrobiales bacterium]
MSLRVVAGTAGGRLLTSPASASTRPTSDRVREATFNALTSLGVVEGATMVDLYAGSGALGIEALSRGATAVTFVDTDARALAVVRANLRATGLQERATVTRSDAARFLATRATRFDVALFDPPYALADSDWAMLLGMLDAEVAVLESDRSVAVDERWDLIRTKRYGGTVVSFIRRSRRRRTE